MRYCSGLNELLRVDKSLLSLGVFVSYTVIWVEETRHIVFEEEVSELIKYLSSRYTLDSIKNDPVFRAYRDFFWRVGIDPTKVRPSSEALVRRCLRGSFPKINTVVDAGNIASAYTGVPIGLYDMSKSSPPYTLTLSKGGEVFNPIGGEVETLPKGIPILTDSRGLVMHLYPHRDSVETSIRDSTTEVFVLGAGVPGVERALVIKAVSRVFELLSKAGWKWCGKVLVKEPSL
ncbi:MAG: phenylalanine--tRNA ligase beta subunit-related protein [Sulfolobales archaeon]